MALGPEPPRGEVSIRVRYAETDQMGRAYYGAYFAWFEVGRVELLRELGATYSELERRDCFLPVVEAEAKYLAPARYDDLLTVTTTLGGLRASRAEFLSEVVRAEGGAQLARGRVVLACMGRDGRPRRLPRLLLDRVRRAVRGGQEEEGDG